MESLANIEHVWTLGEMLTVLVISGLVVFSPELDKYHKDEKKKADDEHWENVRKTRHIKGK